MSISEESCNTRGTLLCLPFLGYHSTHVELDQRNNSVIMRFCAHFSLLNKAHVECRIRRRRGKDDQDIRDVIVVVIIFTVIRQVPSRKALIVAVVPLNKDDTLDTSVVQEQHRRSLQYSCIWWR